MFHISATYQGEFRHWMSKGGECPSYLTLFDEIDKLTSASVHLARVTLTVNADTTNCVTLVIQADVIRSAEEYSNTIAFCVGRPIASGTLNFELRPTPPGAPSPTADKWGRGLPGPGPNVTKESNQKVMHLDALCDQCNKLVIGSRFQCQICPDYDVCEACMKKNGTAAHNALYGQIHRFQEIPTPRPALETETPTVFANCDICLKPISGNRYKCLNCPDFDTCASCFGLVQQKHPGHDFVKFMSSVYYYRDRSTIERHARCDSCKEKITRVRYKCLACPDFDLCDKCEAHPNKPHPVTHPLAKLSRPITTYEGLQAVLNAALAPAPAPAARPASRRLPFVRG
ncbi:hypothetical protein FRB95_011986 [Tulasnella sp. JGI-2019a]|nr:hypothetical protein FRB95_011986 [Tulasnella sp. JGI-2019a]